MALAHQPGHLLFHVCRASPPQHLHTSHLRHLLAEAPWRLRDLCHPWGISHHSHTHITVGAGNCTLLFYIMYWIIYEHKHTWFNFSFHVISIYFYYISEYIGQPSKNWNEGQFWASQSPLCHSGILPWSPRNKTPLRFVAAMASSSSVSPVESKRQQLEASSEHFLRWPISISELFGHVLDVIWMENDDSLIHSQTCFFSPSSDPGIVVRCYHTAKLSGFLGAKIWGQRLLSFWLPLQWVSPNPYAQILHVWNMNISLSGHLGGK